MRKLLSSAAVAAVLLAGCVSNDNVSDKGGSSSSQRLSVIIADDRCDVSTAKTESGRVVFTLKNEDAVEDELEILAPGRLRIVDERENLAPGTTVKYTVVLESGSYYTTCRKNMVGALVGAKRFAISDSGKEVEAGDDEKKLQDQAVSNYNAYNRDQAGQLLEKTKAFAGAYKAGSLNKTRSLYAATRQHYERIELTTEKFGDLDPALNGREADWQETEDKDTRAWKGWHYIEKSFRRPDGLERLNDEQGAEASEQLVVDTRELYDLVYAKDSSIELADISDGVINLLEEITTTKITGEEGAFFHADLQDFRANVESAKVTYDNTEVIAKKRDLALAREISKRFDQLQIELDKYKQGDDYVYYDKLNETQHKQLSDSINASRRPLAKLTGTVLRSAGESTSKKWGGVETMSSEDSEFKSFEISEPKEEAPRGMSRHTVLLGGGLATLGLSAGATVGYPFGRFSGAEEGERKTDVDGVQYPFRGKHQSDIIIPQQQQMHTAAYDVTTKPRKDLVELLKDWTLAAEKLMAGKLVNPMKSFKEVPPDDTGETMNLDPSGLAITFGFGSTLFRTVDGVDRSGIANKKSELLLAEIPCMSAEKLDQTRYGGDLVMRACTEDPIVAMHTIHNLSRIVFGRASARWSQLGYERASSTSKSQTTSHNLFGFKDGTNNIKSDETGYLFQSLWVQEGDPDRDVQEGDTYIACRKIKMVIEMWDDLVLSEQEDIIGRDKIEGAPLSDGKEFTALNFRRKDKKGETVIDREPHMALMHPDHSSGHRMLRRDYNFMEGSDSLGRFQGGLFFIIFVHDSKSSPIRILRKISSDLLMEYLQTTVLALFVIPPGIKEGDEYVGQALFS